MKSLPLLIVSLLVAGITEVDAQKPTLPIDEKTQKVVYTEVVQVEGVSQAELYKRALNWFKTYFPNPTSVIKVQDTTAGKISGQHAIYIYKDIDGAQHKYGQVKYTIELLVKDGRFKLTINDIFKLESPKVYMEEWLDESHADKVNRFSYATQVDKHLLELIEKLKAAMQQVKVEEKEDW